MKIDVRTVMRHPNGKPLKATPDELDDKGNVVKEGEPMTVANVLVHVALQPSPPNKVYTSREQIMRYCLALDAFKASENNDDPEMYVNYKAVALVEDDLNRIYSSVVAGQLLLLLGYEIDAEGEVVPPAGARAPPPVTERPLARAQK